MRIPKVLSTIWAPFARLNYLLRHAESDVAAVYPHSGPSPKDAAITDAVTGMVAQSQTGHVSL